MGGVRHSREQWLSWVIEQESSGLTVAAFCESVGIRENSFYRWRAKLIAESESLAEPQTIAPREASLFVPLTVVQPERVEIDLPCGAVVRVPADDASIGRVLRVLLDATGGEGGASC